MKMLCEETTYETLFERGMRNKSVGDSFHSLDDLLTLTVHDKESDKREDEFIKKNSVSGKRLILKK